MAKNVIAHFRIRGKDVYKLLLRIPADKVSIYGDIARALGYPSAARITGKILNQMLNSEDIPMDGK
jgi:alkylated DNA nucleotide flippase Atl1